MSTIEAIKADIARVEAKRDDPFTQQWFAEQYGSIDDYLASQYDRLAALESAGSELRDEIRDGLLFRIQTATDYRKPAESLGGVPMESPFKVFEGIGNFFNTWAPWLMFIALFYALGTIFNINIKAGVGK